MSAGHQVYLEVGTRRVFAGSVDWPGWCRAAKDEEGALQALAEAGPRYRAALRPSRIAFSPPRDAGSFRIVERLDGDATTDFGAPGISPSADERRANTKELTWLSSILRACWKALDRAAERHAGAELRKGPRGGGRELDAIVAHVVDAEGAYLRSLGGRFREPDGAGPEALAEGVRRAFLDTLGARARGEPLPPSRRTSKVWTPRYAVRRSAWHALDHAWEIEDRAT